MKTFFFFLSTTGDITRKSLNWSKGEKYVSLFVHIMNLAATGVLLPFSQHSYFYHGIQVIHRKVFISAVHLVPCCLPKDILHFPSDPTYSCYSKTAQKCRQTEMFYPLGRGQSSWSAVWFNIWWYWGTVGKEWWKRVMFGGLFWWAKKSAHVGSG